MSNAKGKRMAYEEKINPIQRIIKLMNQYHSIDLVANATQEEKDWAKKRLHGSIINTLKICSVDLQGRIKASIANKDIWEKTREELA